MRRALRATAIATGWDAVDGGASRAQASCRPDECRASEMIVHARSDDVKVSANRTRRANHSKPVKPRPRKYFTFTDFGIAVYVIRPTHTRGGRTSSRTRVRDAVDAGGVGAVGVAGRVAS